MATKSKHSSTGFDAATLREAVGPGFQSGITERLIRRTSTRK